MQRVPDGGRPTLEVDVPLPQTPCSQGSCGVSPSSVRSVLWALARAFDALAPEVSALLDEGSALAHQTDEALRRSAGGRAVSSVRGLGESQGPSTTSPIPWSDGDDRSNAWPSLKRPTQRSRSPLRRDAL